MFTYINVYICTYIYIYIHKYIYTCCSQKSKALQQIHHHSLARATQYIPWAPRSHWRGRFQMRVSALPPWYQERPRHRAPALSTTLPDPFRPPRRCFASDRWSALYQTLSWTTCKCVLNRNGYYSFGSHTMTSQTGTRQQGAQALKLLRTIPYHCYSTDCFIR